MTNLGLCNTSLVGSRDLKLSTIVDCVGHHWSLPSGGYQTRLVSELYTAVLTSFSEASNFLCRALAQAKLMCSFLTADLVLLVAGRREAVLATRRLGSNRFRIRC